VSKIRFFSASPSAITTKREGEMLFSDRHFLFIEEESEFLTKFVCCKGVDMIRATVRFTTWHSSCFGFEKQLLHVLELPSLSVTGFDLI